MKNELLPCPFCGASDALLEPRSKTWGGMSGYTVLSWRVVHWCACGPISGSRIEMVGKTEDEAAGYWNRRTDMKNEGRS